MTISKKLATPWNHLNLGPSTPFETASYGECKIEFSTDKDRNVTLIYAENGVGKTTLLNALLWCFYGETTSRFEKKEDILNYDAKKEGRSLAAVEVLFEHNGSHYIAKRFFRGGNASDGGRTFVVARFDRGGQVDISSPDTFINTVIPRDMAAHFLFDGEHAEVFLGEKNRSSIRGAVRDILGCSLIETAIDDLQAISSQFRKQIPSTPATKKIEELNSRMDALGSQIDTAREEIGRLEKSRQLTEEQIGDIDTKLRNTAAAKELQRSRERLTEQMRRVEKRQKEASDEVYKRLIACGTMGDAQIRKYVAGIRRASHPVDLVGEILPVSEDIFETFVRRLALAANGISRSERFPWPRGMPPSTSWQGRRTRRLHRWVDSVTTLGAQAAPP